jgi:hypothetical protein
MTDQEINIAIAESCGLIKALDYDNPSSSYYRSWKDPAINLMTGAVPSYCHDLNEMAKAEKDGLSDPIEKAKYYHELAKLRKSDLSVRHQIELPMICATALQRAEAFLRAKGFRKP